MSATETLRLIIDADTKGAISSVEGVSKAAEKSGSSLDKLGAGLTRFGVGAAAAGVAALAALGGMAAASEEANFAQLQLQNTLKNMPKLAGESADQFNELADQIQSVTAADADQVVAAEAMLGTFNLTAQQIKGITPLVVDYARKFGVDLVDASVQVGKALDGNSGALKRNGVSIDEAAFAADRYSAVQDALNKQVGGFAEAEGKTFAGSLQRMKNELGDLSEGVGKGAVDAFTTMFGAVDKVAGAMESLSPDAQGLIGKIAAFGAVGLIAVGGLSALVGQVIQARRNFQLAASAIGNLQGKMGTLAGAAGAAGAAIAIVGVSEALASLDDARMSKTLDRITEGFVAAGNELDRYHRALLESSKGAAFLESMFAGLIDTNTRAAEALLDSADKYDLQKDKVRELRKELEQKKDADVQGAVDQDAYSESVREGADALSGEAAAAQEAKSATEQLMDAERARLDPLFATVSAQNALADSNNQVAEAQAALDTAIKEHGADSAEAAAATRDLTAARFDETQAASRYEFALLDLRNEVEKGNVSVSTAKARLADWAAQGLISVDSALQTAAAFDATAAAAEGIPVEALTHVDVTGDDAARTDLRTVRDAAFDIPARVSTHVDITASIDKAAALLGFGGVPRRAVGGPVSRGGLYEVAENRESELYTSGGRSYLIPAESGHITPMHAVPAGAGGWTAPAGNQIIEVTSIVQVDGNELARAVRRSDQRNGLASRT